MIPPNLEEYDYRENLIVDENNPILIQKARRDRYSGKKYWNAGYGGKAYLCRPWSEDALTWNVFRALQLAGEPGLNIIREVFNLSEIDKILFWGCNPSNPGAEQQLLNILIRTIDGRLRGTLTEPDLVFITNEEIVFVECKLNVQGEKSPWRPFGEGSEKRMKIYREKFSELNEIENWKPVYQLIRNYVYAKSLSEYLEKGFCVTPLVSQGHFKDLNYHYSILKDNPTFEESFHPLLSWRDILDSFSSSDFSKKYKLSKKMEDTLEQAK